MPRDFNLSLRHRAHFRMPRDVKEKMLDIWKQNPDAEDREVADALGVSVYSVSRFRQRIGLKRKTGRKHGTIAKPSVLRVDGDGRQRVPDAVLAERERRAIAASMRGFSASALGDPPPGYSALDKRAGA